MRKPAKKQGVRLGDAVWAAMRDEYVTGSESYEKIGIRYHVTMKAVQAHALNRRRNDGKTWAEMRDEFNDDVSRKTEEKVSESLSRVMARVKEKAARVSEQALTKLEDRLTSAEPMEDRDIIQIAKLATTIKIELGGDRDNPISITQTLDSLTTDQLLKLAAGDE